jgi:ribosomal subunit interface protein
MLTSIEARNFELTEAIKSRVEKMVDSQLKIYADGITKTTIILDFMNHRKGGQPNADVKIVVEIPGPDLVAGNGHNDLYEAVDGALDKIVDQMQKRKEK